jgi:hypothetical protein
MAARKPGKPPGAALNDSLSSPNRHCPTFALQASGLPLMTIFNACGWSVAQSSFPSLRAFS